MAVPVRVEADALQELARLVDAQHLFFSQWPDREQLPQRVVANSRMHPDQHVVDRCEIAVEAQGLKGASDPETGDRVRWATGQLGRAAAVGQPNAARLRGDIARDQVDERRLAGAVRSDQ